MSTNKPELMADPPSVRDHIRKILARLRDQINGKAPRALSDSKLHP